MLARDRSLFGLSFEDNKRAVAQISDIESKFLRNKIAGYITSVHRKEKIKLEQESNDSSDLLDEKVAMSEIKIKIKALGQLSKIIDSPEFIISHDDCKLRSVLLKILNYDDPSQIETTLNSILVSINGIEMSVLNGLDTELNNEDNIVIIPIMHGG